MREDQIVNQLKGLSQIKPDKAWKKDTMSYILSFDSNQPQGKEFSRGFLSFFNFGFNFGFKNFKFNSPKLAPAFVSLAILIVIIGSGFLFYPHITQHSSNDSSSLTAINQTTTSNQDSNSTKYLVLAEDKLNTIKDSKDVATVVNMLDKASKAMPAISKDPVATAKAVKSVAIINQKIGSIEKDKNKDVSQDEIKQLKEKSQTLTSLTSKALEDKINSTIAELIKTYERASLTPEQEQLFQKAKADYNNKNFEKALEEILQIQEI